MEDTLTDLLSDDTYLAQRRTPQPGEYLYLHLSDLEQAIRDVANSQNCQRVLDYGCGGSPYREFFPCTHYERADFGAAGAIDYAISANGTIKAESGRYDMVLSTQVLEHVVDSGRYLSECRRMLRDGGTLLLSTHGTFADHPCPSDFRRWTCEGLRHDLEEAGFKVTDLRKLTTDGRALAFLMRTRVSSIALRRRPLFGWLFWGLSFVIHRFSRAFDKWCDANLTDCRVVSADTPMHDLYIGILVTAVKC